MTMTQTMAASYTVHQSIMVTICEELVEAKQMNYQLRKNVQMTALK